VQTRRCMEPKRSERITPLRCFGPGSTATAPLLGNAPATLQTITCFPEMGFRNPYKPSPVSRRWVSEIPTNHHLFPEMGFRNPYKPSPVPPRWVSEIPTNHHLFPQDGFQNKIVGQTCIFREKNSSFREAEASYCDFEYSLLLSNPPPPLS
jgi:hypothetical protein